jgi:ribosomal silencing factor RsfS
MVNNLNLIKIENIIVKINRKIIRKLYKIHKMLQNKHYNVIENLKKNILTIDRMHRKN